MRGARPLRILGAVTRLLGVAALLLSSSVALASPPPGTAGGMIPDIVDARSLGLSAGIATAIGNDGIYLNPAGVAARKRYSVEGLAVFARNGAETTDRFFGGSVVDSQTRDVAAGFSYLRSQGGPYRGNLFHLALGGPLARGLFLGVGGKYLTVDRDEAALPAAAAPSLKRSTSAVTADVGVLWQVADYLSVGGTGYNLVPVGNAAVAPMGAGAGVAVGSDTSFQLTFDWRADFDRGTRTKNRYAVGAEALLFQFVPVRAGWMDDEVYGAKWWSAGVGLVTTAGVALDVGYRQMTSDASIRVIAANLKLFLFQ